MIYPAFSRAFLAGCLLVAVAPSAQAQSHKLSLGFRGAAAASIGGSTTASLVGVEYEVALSTLVSLTFGAGQLNYEYKNDDSYSPYNEKGSGVALSAEVKFYPQRRLLHGLYVGPGLSTTNLSVDYTRNPGRHYEYEDSYSGVGVEAHGTIGYAFHPAEGLTIDPNLQVGYFLAAPKYEKQDTVNLSVFVLAGIKVGLRF